MFGMHALVIIGCCAALTEVKFNVFFGGGVSFQPIHLDELECSGAEATLLNCTHSGIGVHNCDHPEDVGIICQRSQGKVVISVTVMFFSIILLC